MTREEIETISKDNIKDALEGRPTKYKREYCELLVDFVGEQGFSYEAFAGYIGVHVDTLYEWEKTVYPKTHPDQTMVGKLQHPEFSEAKKIAFSRNRIYWERAGMSIMYQGGRDVSPSAWIFNMKNRFKWRDNVDVTTDGEKVSTLNDLLGALKSREPEGAGGTA